QYINDNILAAPVTVSSVAEELGLSPAYFARLFQRRMGIAPVKYIIKVKMAQAKRMLTEGNYSIKEIAAALHYENQLYFSRQFTRDVGIPPRQYRAETRSKS
ncbi:MAG: AraC family transcriptional regulator, partial [Eubacteriales bacterium]|nr:AraC family transcriptional regulator [Eubacteriales bacterium]